MNIDTDKLKEQVRLHFEMEMEKTNKIDIYDIKRSRQMGLAKKETQAMINIQQVENLVNKIY